MATYPEFRLGGIPLEQEHFAEEERRWAWIAVQFGERAFALLLLLLLLPVLLLAGLLVLALSRRCPLVAHARVGRHGKEIWVLKLRTMWGGPVLNRGGRGFLIERVKEDPPARTKNSEDERITSGFAARCRKYSVDELPQLWHVVQGDLSLVGPRPLTAGELSEHYGPAAKEILRLRPGLTGLWQIKGRNRLNYRRRRRLDLFLVRHWSFRLYFAILFTTVPKVLRGVDAW